MPQTREGFCVMALWPPTFYLRVVRRSIILPTLPPVSFVVFHFPGSPSATSSSPTKELCCFVRSIDSCTSVQHQQHQHAHRYQTEKTQPCRPQNSSRSSTHPPHHTHTQTSASRRPLTSRDDARLLLAAAYPVRAGAYIRQPRPLRRPRQQSWLQLGRACAPCRSADPRSLTLPERFDTVGMHAITTFGRTTHLHARSRLDIS